MNIFGIGGLELLVIALVAFLVLGPRKMADAGKSAAKILSELRKQRDELTTAILDESASKRDETKHPAKDPSAVAHQATAGAGGDSVPDTTPTAGQSSVARRPSDERSE